MEPLATDHPAYQSSSEIFLAILNLCRYRARINTGVAVIDCDIQPPIKGTFRFSHPTPGGCVQGTFTILQVDDLQLKRGLKGTTLLEFTVRSHPHDEYVVE